MTPSTLSRRFLLSALSLAISATVSATPFVVQDIRVEGLQRVSAGTVFNYLPLRPGQTVDPDHASQAVTDLYATNLFSSVSLAQDGGTLVVQVKEFPVISTIELKGNSSLNSSTIKEAFASAGVAEGQPYNPAMLQDMVNELYRQYQSLSKYQVKIDLKVNNLPRGRVSIEFDIDEGRTGQIKQIDFVGNEIYDDARLAKLFDTSTTGMWSFISKDDQLNPATLAGDLQRLSDFYMDRGFLDFKVTSTQTSLSPDKTQVYLTVNVSEGQPYTLTGYDFGGNTLLSTAELDTLVEFQTGTVYDRSKVKESIEAMEDRLGDEGYANARVNIVPDVDRLTHEVFLNLVFDPGERVTVRRISFTGNNKSYDTVLRRELRQQEMAVYSASDMRRSEQRISRLPQVEALETSILPVPGHPDQIDVEYKITERSTSYIQGGVGYGQSSGALFSLQYTDDNFIGSGNRLNVNFTRGSSYTSYGFTYTDPYLTEDGISSSFSFKYSDYDYDEEDLSDWTADELNLIQTFGYPISEYQSIFFGGGYRRVKITTGDDVAYEIEDYLDDNGHTYNEYVLTSAWTKDTTDDAYMPTTGASNAINAEITLPGSDATYYRINYNNKTYFSGEDPDSLIFDIHGKVGYGDGYGDNDGDGRLPFYRHYYAGGLATVRGFSYGTIGPHYTNGDFSGGDLLVSGGMELMLPISFDQRTSNFRVGAFVDAGSVWADAGDFDTGDIRYSTGLFLQWYSPIGPLNVSYGVPLNKKDRDEEENFQFTIGSAF